MSPPVYNLSLRERPSTQRKSLRNRGIPVAQCDGLCLLFSGAVQITNASSSLAPKSRRPRRTPPAPVLRWVRQSSGVYVSADVGRTRFVIRRNARVWHVERHVRTNGDWIVDRTETARSLRAAMARCEVLAVVSGAV